MTTTDEAALAGLLQQMVEDIKDPQCAYWLYANFFEVQPPTERRIIRWWQAPLYFDYDALWNPQIEVDAMLIDVILKNQLPAKPERIRIEYGQIWSLKRIHWQQKLKAGDDGTVYHDSSKLKMPPTDTDS